MARNFESLASLGPLGCASATRARVWARRGLRAGAVSGLFAALIGCSSAPPATPDAFVSSTTFQHNYASVATTTCEASRRVLLSQGYAIDKDQGTSVDATKNFEDNQGHMVLSFHVVCVADHSATPSTTVFANAVQDRYVMKRDTSTAGVGLSVLGSVSLPFMSSADSLTKSSSVTVTSSDFYSGFFDLVKEYLPQSAPWVPLPANVPPVSVHKGVEKTPPKPETPAAVPTPTTAAPTGATPTNPDTPANRAAQAPAAPATPSAPASGASPATNAARAAPAGASPSAGSGSSSTTSGSAASTGPTPAAPASSTPATAPGASGSGSGATAH